MLADCCSNLHTANTKFDVVELCAQIAGTKVVVLVAAWLKEFLELPKCHVTLFLTDRSNLELNIIISLAFVFVCVSVSQRIAHAIRVVLYF